MPSTPTTRPPRRTMQGRKRLFACLALLGFVMAGAPWALAQGDNLAELLDAGDRRVRISNDGDLARVQVDRENRTGEDLVIASIRGSAALAGSRTQDDGEVYGRTTLTRFVVFEDADGNGFPSARNDRIVADVPLRNLDWEARSVDASGNGHTLVAGAPLPEEAGGGMMVLQLAVEGNYLDETSAELAMTDWALQVRLVGWEAPGAGVSFALVADEREDDASTEPLRPDSLTVGTRQMPLQAYSSRDRGDSRTVVLVSDAAVGGSA